MTQAWSAVITTCTSFQRLDIWLGRRPYDFWLIKSNKITFIADH